jgi:nucleotide-binding universal stress UspA family protein
MNTKSTGLILVPTDFSETCHKAIGYAAEMANKMNFSITLLHVITSKTKNTLKKEHKGLETIIEQLEVIKKDIEKKYKINVTYTAREGSIFEVINRVAGEIRANFMVLGTHGKKGLQYLFGSYAFKVVSQSPVPVVVVQQNSAYSSLKTIIFPVNTYIESRQQVMPTVRLSQQMDSKIVIFRQHASEILEKNQLAIVTEQIIERFEEAKISYEIHEAEIGSHYEQQLINFAVMQDAGAIVMMTDSRPDHPDFNNSSWSERLIFNDAAIPVICINPVYYGKFYFGL